MRAQDIRSFLGGRHPQDKGLYVSTGGFTKDAHYEAERANIPLSLMTIDDLVPNDPRKLRQTRHGNSTIAAAEADLLTCLMTIAEVGAPARGSAGYVGRLLPAVSARNLRQQHRTASLLPLMRVPASAKKPVFGPRRGPNHGAA